MIVFCGSGASCNRAFRNPFASVGPPAPEVLQLGMSLDQVVAAVNQNASRIVSYQTNSALITVPGMPGTTTATRQHCCASAGKSAIASVDCADRLRSRLGRERRAVLVLGQTKRATGVVL